VSILDEPVSLGIGIVRGKCPPSMSGGKFHVRRDYPLRLVILMIDSDVLTGEFVTQI
jgi:hypothetical protein